jgi:hypothetical protein
MAGRLFLPAVRRSGIMSFLNEVDAFSGRTLNKLQAACRSDAARQITLYFEYACLSKVASMEMLLVKLMNER